MSMLVSNPMILNYFELSVCQFKASVARFINALSSLIRDGSNGDGS